MPRKVRSAAVESLDEVLKRQTAPAAPELVESMEDRRVRCLACGHRCVVLEGLDGICKVRFNRGGELFVPRGYVAGLAVDPIEKKPFFHVLPGSDALSFGMLGCDLHCPYCQNWLSSQTLRDESALVHPREVSAAEMVALADRENVPIVVSTYNEPLITSEWAVEVFEPARAKGMLCGYVSNGHGSPEVLEYLRPHMDLFKIDLKGFRKDTYRNVGGTLDNVTETIQAAYEAGFWVEIVTLLVPGFNDSDEELRDLVGFLASVSVDIPWHVTAFHADYKMNDRRRTSVSDLVRAVEIGKAAGLRYVYAGNLPGAVKDLENTRCHECGSLLVERTGFRVYRNRLKASGCCPECGTAVPGVWTREKTA